MTSHAAPFRHDQPGKVALVLINLGTPDAPTAEALRPYLREFLSDPRVVEIPRAIWWWILNGIIVPFRSKKSAAKYAQVWTPDGSPLMVHTQRQATLLRGYLGDRGHQIDVHVAMRYGNPSIPSVLQQIQDSGASRILVLPAYPQYSAATTASVFDSVFDYCKRRRNVPDLRLIRNYHDHAGYINALKESVQQHWLQNGRGDVLVMSFHGVPKRTLLRGDPYHCECHKTARLLAESLGLGAADYRVTFQSRFGRAEWLQPYTQPTVEALAKDGVQRVDVICPGFTSDCLETLEEINMEVRQAFMLGGGKAFHYIPCLNEDAAWIAAMTDLVEPFLHGWPTRAVQQDAARTGAARSAQLAVALGAEQ